MTVLAAQQPQLNQLKLMRLPDGTPSATSRLHFFACMFGCVCLCYAYVCVSVIKFAYTNAYGDTLCWSLTHKSKFVQTLAPTANTAATARYLCQAQLSASAALIATGNLKMPKLFTTTYINCPMSDVNAALIYWI